MDSYDNGIDRPQITEIKKREMFDLIDNISKPQMTNFNQKNLFQKKQVQRVNNGNNKKQQVRGDIYWNDWFGRPGAGAPTWTTYKQNLDKMLEPSSKDLLNSQPNFSKVYSLNNNSPRKPKSNHYNNYELV